MYKSIHIGFTSDPEKRAQLIDEKANEMENQGFELVNVASTHHCGAILTFTPKAENSVAGVYKSIHIGFTSNPEKRAQLMDEKAEEMAAQGYKLMSAASTFHNGIIMTFKK